MTHLKYPHLHFHICDDGSGEADDGSGKKHVDVISEAIVAGGHTVTAHEMERKGDTFKSACNIGGSINRGVQLAHQQGVDIHLMVLDDWSLKWNLDIRPHVETLAKHQGAGMIRYGYVVPGLGAVTMGFETEMHGNHYYLYWRLIRDWCLHNPYSKNDPYLVCMMAYLAHYRFFESYGWIPEHLPPGETEVKWVWQYNRHPLQETGPQILVPIGYCYGSQDSYFANTAERGRAYAEFSA